jgi:hypothetical protein
MIAVAAIKILNILNMNKKNAKAMWVGYTPGKHPKD